VLLRIAIAAISGLVFIPLALILFKFSLKRKTLLLNTLIWLFGIGPAVQEIFSPRTLLSMSNSNSQAALLPGNWSLISTLVSLGMIYLSVLAIFYGLFCRQKIPVTGFKLWTTIIVFSFTSFASGLLGIEPGFNRGQLFIPLIFTAVFLQPSIPLPWFISQVKRVLLVYFYGSLLASVLVPAWASEFNYISFIPGMNFRLYGLTPQANVLGPLPVLYLILEWLLPTKSLWKWLNIGSALLVLLLCQSKTAWAIMMIVVTLKVTYEVLHLPKKQFSYLLFLGCVGFIIVGFSVGLILTDVGSIMIHSDKLDSLTTLTGRTEVWDITLDYWKQNFWFGYGPKIWSSEFRMQYGEKYLWVGQAHNQFIQSLGEAGIFGFAALLFYIFALTSTAVQFLRSTRSLSLALVTLLLLRSISEAGFRNYTIDQAFFIHFVVFTVLLLLARQQQQIIHYEKYTHSSVNDLSQSA